MREDLSGRKFGLLTVIERADDYINQNGTKDVAMVVSL